MDSGGGVQLFGGAVVMLAVDEIVLETENVELTIFAVL
jgi:hypothetical protein